MTEKTVLPNGVRIVSEDIPGVRSVAIGIWVGAGSRKDPTGKEGLAHFTEHMMFKGTDARSAFDIASGIDALGGVLNAHTAKEYTAYYVKVLDEHIDKAADILEDLFLNSNFPEEEIEKEKQVVLQEIRMSEDSPDEHISDLFAKAFFRGSSLSSPILGTGDTLRSFTRQDILDFVSSTYTPGSIVVVSAGNIRHAKLVDMTAERFGSLKKEQLGESPLIERLAGGGNLVVQKDLEQVHLIIGTKGPSMKDDQRWAYIVLNTIFGGGMSSMLFQEARERLGLVYSIYSYIYSYNDCGAMAVYAATTPEQLEPTLNVVGGQIQRLKKGEFGGMTLDDIKAQIKGHLLLSRESTESRMASVGKNELYYGRDVPVEEMLEKINMVTTDDLVSLAQEIFARGKMTFVALGKVMDKKEYLSSIL